MSLDLHDVRAVISARDAGLHVCKRPARAAAGQAVVTGAPGVTAVRERTRTLSGACSLDTIVRPR